MMRQDYGLAQQDPSTQAGLEYPSRSGGFSCPQSAHPDARGCKLDAFTHTSGMSIGPLKRVAFDLNQVTRFNVLFLREFYSKNRFALFENAL